MPRERWPASPEPRWPPRCYPPSCSRSEAGVAIASPASLTCPRARWSASPAPARAPVEETRAGLSGRTGSTRARGTTPFVSEPAAILPSARCPLPQSLMSWRREAGVTRRLSGVARSWVEGGAVSRAEPRLAIHHGEILVDSSLTTVQFHAFIVQNKIYSKIVSELTVNRYGSPFEISK